jgi:hypothetical protein
MSLLDNWRPSTPNIARSVIKKLTEKPDDAVFTPQYRQGVVVSNDYTNSPWPTCTVQIGNSAVPAAGVRYMQPYAPFVGDVVYIVVMPKGDPWILGKLKSAQPSGRHYACYTTGSNSAAILTNGTLVLSTWSSKETNGLSEPQGALEASLPTTGFTIPFDSVWEIHCTTSLTADLKGWGLRLETSSPVTTRQAESWAGNPDGGSGPMNNVLSVSMKRFFLGGNVFRVRVMNANTTSAVVSADGLNNPTWISFSSSDPISGY